MERRSWFSKQISLGSLLALLSILVGAAWNYITVYEKVQIHDIQIVELRQITKEMNDQWKNNLPTLREFTILREDIKEMRKMLDEKDKKNK